MTPPPQIRNLLSHATGLYATGDLQAAKEVVKDIIRLDGQSAQGYTLLSHIHEDMGNAKEAANALYMGALHASRDAAAWLRAARMARDIGFEQQALKCFDEYARGTGLGWLIVGLSSWIRGICMSCMKEASCMLNTEGRGRYTNGGDFCCMGADGVVGH